MKKVFNLLIIFLFFPAVFFAFEWNLEVSVDTPVNVGYVQSSDPEQLASGKSGMQGGIYIGGNVGVDFMFNDIIGLGANLGIYGSPLNAKPLIGNSNNLNKNQYEYIMENTTTVNGNYRYFYTSFFLGPVIRAVACDNFILDLTPGMEFNNVKILDGSAHWEDYVDGGVYWQEGNFEYKCFEFGLGLDTKMAFRVSDLISINVGFLNSFTFFQKVSGTKTFTDSDGKENTSSIDFTYNPIFDVKFSPRVGVNFLF